MKLTDTDILQQFIPLLICFYVKQQAVGQLCKVDHSNASFFKKSQ